MRGALTVQPSWEAADASMRAFFARLKADPPAALPGAAPPPGAAAAAPPQEAHRVDAIALLMAGVRGAAAAAGAARREAPRPAPKLEPVCTEDALPAQPAAAAVLASVEQAAAPDAWCWRGAGAAGVEGLRAAVRLSPAGRWAVEELEAWAAWAVSRGEQCGAVRFGDSRQHCPLCIAAGPELVR